MIKQTISKFSRYNGTCTFVLYSDFMKTASDMHCLIIAVFGEGLKSLPLFLQGNISSSGNTGCHTFTQQTVMHYSNDSRSKEPKMYQACSSTKSGPGGVSNK